jgi:hypothetical protein
MENSKVPHKERRYREAAYRRKAGEEEEPDKVFL